MINLVWMFMTLFPSRLERAQNFCEIKELPSCCVKQLSRGSGGLLPTYLVWVFPLVLRIEPRAFTQSSILSPFCFLF